MPEYLDAECSCKNKGKKDTFSFHVFLSDEDTIIEEKKYYAFNFLPYYKNDTIGFLRYDQKEGKLYFLNTGYHEEDYFLCKGEASPYGKYGDVCSPHLFLELREVYYYYYVYHVGFIGSYFAQLNEFRKEDNDTLLQFNYKQSDIYKPIGGERSHLKGRTHFFPFSIKTMTISKKNGFISMQLISKKDQEIYECWFYAM